MKKILIFIILLLPFYVYAEDSCSQDDIQIESIVLDSTQGNIEQTSEPTNDNNSINLGLKANVIDDNAVYKVVIKNTSNQDYTFDKSSLSTDYLNYDITYEDDSDIVKAGESKTIYLKVHYATKPSTESLSNGTVTTQPKVTFNLQKDEEVKTIVEEVVNAITNPNTNDKVLIYFGVLVLSFIITIILLRKYKKLRNTTMLIILFLTTTQIVKAVCVCTLDINTELEIDAKEAIFLPGTEVNVKMKELAGTDTSTATVLYNKLDENINAIKFSEIEPVETNKQEANIVSISESGYPIYMWFDNGTIYWWSKDTTPSLNTDASYMFYMMNNLEDISGLENFDLSNTTNMRSTFHRIKITTPSNLKKWNTSNVTDMYGLFYGIQSIKNLDGLEKWNTSKVEDMSSMFLTDIELVDVSALKNWNVTSVKSMERMFSTCFKIEEVDLSEWETKSLENINGMFAQSWISDGQGGTYTGGSLKKIILSEKFDTSKVTKLDLFVYNNKIIEDYEFLKYLDTSNIKSMDHVFFSNYGLKDTYYLKDWDVSKVENMHGLFIGTKNLTDLSGLENWDTSSATNISYMFRHCYSLTSLKGLEKWNVSKVTNYIFMFDGCNKLEETNYINDWDINNEADFNRMFTGTQSHPEFTKVQGTWNNGTFVLTP